LRRCPLRGTDSVEQLDLGAEIPRAQLRIPRPHPHRLMAEEFDDRELARRALQLRLE
jgi:hypothetical protein